MSACTKCSKPIENEAFTGVLCQQCYAAQERQNNATRRGLLEKIPIPLVVGLVPFFVSYRVTHSTSLNLNGLVLEDASDSIDYVAVALGPLALILGILALVSALKAPMRTRAVGLAVLGILLGAVQLYRGLH
jgi:hypothetical protein